MMILDIKIRRQILALTLAVANISIYDLRKHSHWYMYDASAACVTVKKSSKSLK